jgi:hypothetical protein
MVSPLVGFLFGCLDLVGSMARPLVVSLGILYWVDAPGVGRFGLAVQHGLPGRTASWIGPRCVVCVGLWWVLTEL